VAALLLFPCIYTQTDNYSLYYYNPLDLGCNWHAAAWSKRRAGLRLRIVDLSLWSLDVLAGLGGLVAVAGRARLVA
jgi:hypothetical protein